VSKLSFPVRIILTILLLSILIPAAANNAAAAVPADLVELEAFLDALMAAQKEEFRFEGTVISIVKDGEVLLLRGFGYSDPEKHIPVDPERTLFRPGSVSKLITWTCRRAACRAGEN